MGVVRNTVHKTIEISHSQITSAHSLKIKNNSLINPQICGQ